MSCGKLYCQSSLYGWNGFLIFVSVLWEAVLSVFLVWLEWLLNICQCLVGSCTNIKNGFLIFVSVYKEAVLSVFLVWLEWLLNICQCLVGSCTVSLPCMVGMAS